MKNNFLLGLLVVFVLVNLASTYWQSYQLPLDGDLIPVVLPAPQYSHVLHDPFGWSVLTEHKSYPATNRFFAHATMFLYWHKVPLLLQAVMDPISSLYATSALFTTLTVVLIVFALAAYIRLSGAGGKGAYSLWIAAALLIPMFQTYGFYEQMGIVNNAITYTSFYAFPTALLLVLLWPFYKAAHEQRPLRLRPLQVLLLVLLMVVIAFNGPIPVAIIAIVLAGIGCYWLWQKLGTSPRQLTLTLAPNNWLSGQGILLLVVLASLCLYSLYIGRNNSENAHSHTLSELYELLPKGIDQQLMLDWGLRLLLAVLAINLLLISFLIPASPERHRILRIMGLITLFILVYVALLPFGGYRPYRPLLVRNDSILPVLLGFIFAYGLSTYFLLFQLRGFIFGGYLVAVLLLSATFIYVDKTTGAPRNNGCEQWALDQMSQSTEPVVNLSNYCYVLTWGLITDPNESMQQVKMLRYWRVTKHTEQYFQYPPTP